MKLVLIISSIFIHCCLIAQISFKTGNAELEASLNQLNIEAKADLAGFKTSLCVDFGVSKVDVDKLFSLKIEPAEVHLACSIIKITDKPVSTVIDSYKKNKGKGWGVIAKEMGIKPGSPEFHELKGKNKPKGGNKGKSNGKGNGKGKGKSK